MLYCIQKYFTYDFSTYTISAVILLIFVWKNSGTILRFEFSNPFPCRVKIAILTTMVAGLAWNPTSKRHKKGHKECEYKLQGLSHVKHTYLDGING